MTIFINSSNIFGDLIMRDVQHQRSRFQIQLDLQWNLICGLRNLLLQLVVLDGSIMIDKYIDIHMYIKYISLDIMCI